MAMKKPEWTISNSNRIIITSKIDLSLINSILNAMAKTIISTRPEIRAVRIKFIGVNQLFQVLTVGIIYSNTIETSNRMPAIADKINETVRKVLPASCHRAMKSIIRLIENSVTENISRLIQEVFRLFSAFTALAGLPRWIKDINIAKSSPSKRRNSGVFRLKPDDSCKISSMLKKKASV
jgi:hypothetical protein